MVVHQHSMVEKETFLRLVAGENFEIFIKIFLFLKYPVAVIAAVHDMVDVIGQPLCEPVLAFPPLKAKSFRKKYVCNYLFLNANSGPVLICSYRCQYCSEE